MLFTKERLMRRSTGLFVNLPVKSLAVSMDFFKRLGFDFDSRYTDDSMACMIVGENIYVMFLLEPFFKTFTRNEIPDARKSTEVILAVSVDSREQVDDLVNKAVSIGGKQFSEPVDREFMYSWSFQDLDGHFWEIFHMKEEE